MGEKASILPPVVLPFCSACFVKLLIGSVVFCGLLPFLRSSVFLENVKIFVGKCENMRWLPVYTFALVSNFDNGTWLCQFFYTWPNLELVFSFSFLNGLKVLRTYLKFCINSKAESFLVVFHEMIFLEAIQRIAHMQNLSNFW